MVAERGAGSDTEEVKYRRALEACTRIAEEEFEVASVAVRDAEAVCRRLRSSVASVAAGPTRVGASDEDARLRLREFEAKLDATVSTFLGLSRASLEAKRTTDRRFVVSSPDNPERPQAEKHIREIEGRLAAPPTAKDSSPAPDTSGRTKRTEPHSTPTVNSPPSGRIPEHGSGWLPWASVGLTAALAGGAAVTAWSMRSKYNELLSSCGGTPAGCPADRIASVRCRLVAANVLWGLAAVSAAATGVIFFVDARGDERAVGVALRF